MMVQKTLNGKGVVMKTKQQRRYDNRVHAERQLKIAKAHGFSTENAHRFEKTHATTCGDSNCAMCGNPRKFFGEETIQERRFKQKEFDLED